MSRLSGERECWCCGTPWSNSGCVRGPQCNCGLGLDSCQICHKCPKHCKCDPKLSAIASAAWNKFNRPFLPGLIRQCQEAGFVLRIGSDVPEFDPAKVAEEQVADMEKALMELLAKREHYQNRLKQL